MMTLFVIHKVLLQSSSTSQVLRNIFYNTSSHACVDRNNAAGIRIQATEYDDIIRHTQTYVCNAKDGIIHHGNFAVIFSAIFTKPKYENIGYQLIRHEATA